MRANPHGGSLAEAAREALERLAAEPNWRGAGIDAMVAGKDTETGE